MKRILALVASVAMVAGAWTLRQSWEADGSPGFGSGEPLRVVCVTELRSACEELAVAGLEVRVEEAAATADALTEDPQVSDDGWVTLQPWPQIVADRRTRAGLDPLAGSTTPLGWSPLVMAAWQERAAVLEQRCRGGLSWRCVGQLADRPWASVGGDTAWGDVKVGYPDPRTTAAGLVVLGHATAQFFETPDISTRDLDSDEFRAWLASLVNGTPSRVRSERAPVRQMLVQGPAYLDVAGAIEADAGALLARSAERARGLTLRYPEDPAIAEAVLAPLDDTRGDRLREMVEEVGLPALAAAGWRVEGQPVAEGVDGTIPRPGTSGLPSAGALEALRERYAETSR